MSLEQRVGHAGAPESRKRPLWEGRSETFRYGATLVTASLATIAVSAGAAELLGYAGQAPSAIASYTTAIELGAFCTLFAPIYYALHREDYRDAQTKRPRWRALTTKFAKLALTGIPACLVFYPATYLLNRYLLEGNVNPWFSTVVSYVGAVLPSSSVALLTANLTGVVNGHEPSEETGMPKDAVSEKLS